MIRAAALALALGLAGCATAAGGAATVQQACIAAQPVFTAAVASPNAKAAATAVYGNAFCGPVLAGNMPPTANANSAAWVLGLVSALAPVLIGAL